MSETFFSDNGGIYIPPCPLSIRDISLEYITPEKAKEYLESQAPNRRIKQGLVDKICRDIENGLWKFNGDTICFNNKGQLMDGQHRMKAFVKTNTGHWCLVVKNLQDESNNSKDTGVSRTAGDIFSFNEISDGNKKAALVRLTLTITIAELYGLKAFNTDALRKDAIVSISNNTSKTTFSPSELLQEYLAHKQFYDDAHSFGQLCRRTKKYLNAAYLSGVFAYLTLKLQYPKHIVESFWEKIYFERESDFNAINLLRDFLQENLEARLQKSVNGRYGPDAIHDRIVKVFNLFVKGKDIPLSKGKRSQKLPFNLEKEGRQYFASYSAVESNKENLFQTVDKIG